MKSAKLGKSTSGAGKVKKVEVSGVSPHGLWLLVHEKEYFLPFAEYPWFKKATIEQILNVRLHFGHHLEWPDIDVDLHLESLSDPGRFPLMYR